MFLYISQETGHTYVYYFVRSYDAVSAMHNF